MAEAPIEGTGNRPFWENVYDRVVEFHGGGSPYAIADFTVFRRFYSENAITHNDDPNAIGLTQDLVNQTKLTWSLAHDWPWDNAAHALSTPPFDVEPTASSVGLEGGTLGSLPTLPTFTGAHPCAGQPGRDGNSSIQSAGVGPGLRAVYVPGGNQPTRGEVPEPPSFGGHTGTWGSLGVTLQLCYTGIEIVNVADDPGFEGGATYEEQILNFSGLTWTKNNGRVYEAIQAAVYPQDWSAYARNPLWTGTPTSLKGTNSVRLWVLMQLQT